MGRVTVGIDLSKPLEELWNDIPRKRRGDIRRAKRRGVKVEMDSHYGGFRDIYRGTRKELNLPPWDISRREMEACKLFVALDSDGEVVAGEAFMFCKRRMRIKHVASKRYDPEKRSIAGLAHALLVWEAIKWGKKRGIFDYYDFGGYNPDGYANKIDVTTINTWKTGFGGSIIEKVC